MSEAARETFSHRVASALEALLRNAVLEITQIFVDSLSDYQLEVTASALHVSEEQPGDTNDSRMNNATKQECLEPNANGGTSGASFVKEEEKSGFPAMVKTEVMDIVRPSHAEAEGGCTMSLRSLVTESTQTEESTRALQGPQAPLSQTGLCHKAFHANDITATRFSSSVEQRSKVKNNGALTSRLYRERRDANPERREAYLQKERERWTARKLERRRIADLPEKGQKDQRKKWREAKKASRTKAPTIVEQQTPHPTQHLQVQHRFGVFGGEQLDRRLQSSCAGPSGIFKRNGCEMASSSGLPGICRSIRQRQLKSKGRRIRLMQHVYSDHAVSERDLAQRRERDISPGMGMNCSYSDDDWLWSSEAETNNCVPKSDMQNADGCDASADARFSTAHNLDLNCYDESSISASEDYPVPEFSEDIGTDFSSSAESKMQRSGNWSADKLKERPAMDSHMSDNHTTGKASGTTKCSKKQYCVFCNRPCAKIARHLEHVHCNEPEVVKAFQHPKGSKKRHLLLEHLRNRGNFLHNAEVLETGKGVVVPFRRTRTEVDSQCFTHCIYCQGFFVKKYLGHHLKGCKLKSSGNVEPWT